MPPSSSSSLKQWQETEWFSKVAVRLYLVPFHYPHLFQVPVQQVIVLVEETWMEAKTRSLRNRLLVNHPLHVLSHNRKCKYEYAIDPALTVYHWHCSWPLRHNAAVWTPPCSSPCESFHLPTCAWNKHTRIDLLTYIVQYKYKSLI